MTKENVGGIFFTEQEADFGKLFNEFNSYVRNLDREMAGKEQRIFNLSEVPPVEEVVQALDSYSSAELSDLKSHFNSLNEAFDSIENRIQEILNAIIT